MKLLKQDVVMMMNGALFVGNVQTDVFSMKIDEDNIIPIRRNRIVHIMTRNTGTGADEILMLGGSSIRGTLIESGFTMVMDDNILKLKFANTHSIQMGSNMSVRRKY